MRLSCSLLRAEVGKPISMDEKAADDHDPRGATGLV
jgi:hypothetical protein